MAEQKSSEIAAALGSLNEVILWIDDRLKIVDIAPDAKNKLAAGCFDQALEHAAAISTLVSGQLLGSAHALMRPLWESFVRGMWLTHCASERDVQGFLKDVQQPPTKNMVQEISVALGHGGSSVLTRTQGSQWNALCSFAHTGVMQVARRYEGNILKPNYQASEIAQLCGFAGSVSLLSAIGLATLSLNVPLAESHREDGRSLRCSINVARPAMSESDSSHQKPTDLKARSDRYAAYCARVLGASIGNGSADRFNPLVRRRCIPNASYRGQRWPRFLCPLRSKSSTLERSTGGHGQSSTPGGDAEARRKV